MDPKTDGGVTEVWPNTPPPYLFIIFFVSKEHSTLFMQISQISITVQVAIVQPQIVSINNSFRLAIVAWLLLWTHCKYPRRLTTNVLKNYQQKEALK